MYKARNECAPKYICDLVEMYSPTRTFRSSSQFLLKNSDTPKTTYGSRPFRVTAPIRIRLPKKLKRIPTLKSLKEIKKLFDSNGHMISRPFLMSVDMTVIF